ncbi:MAG: cytochrome c3 family protein [Actinobacteria bacterium]|nr:cytochrome c3 family protein [Actinomycetota bacterium]MCG2808391.1 cytochrome c3 family protein [Coriobacteriia bacterium]
MHLFRRIIAALLVAAAVWALPVVAQAQDYDLNFTLPTAGKSGCMVCHADKNLGRVKGSTWVSYWVDPTPLDAGPHASIMCAGCHVDFAYKAPHNIEQTEWARTAKLSCKNCHQEQWKAYSQGVHSIATQPGETIDKNAPEKPLCGDCHGGHDIMALTENPQGKAKLRSEGEQICGRCHKDFSESYADYYHGAAYQEGATDAPACWQCHGWHDILPSSDRRAKVHESNLQETCAQCHSMTNETYISYSGLIHKRQQAYEENVVYSFIMTTKASIQEFLGHISSWFT